MTFGNRYMFEGLMNKVNTGILQLFSYARSTNGDVRCYMYMCAGLHSDVSLQLNLELGSSPVLSLLQYAYISLLRAIRS